MNQNFDASMYSIQLETMNSNFEIMNQNIANLQGALQVLFRLTIGSLLAQYWLHRDSPDQTQAAILVPLTAR